ncbi:MAG: hypothetical protein M4D80_22180 [Myxococcota bacterium]|nr:hypothetical protein [Myxococcota bacterium]
MKWLIAVAMTIGVAHAAPITPPPGWTADPSLAAPPAATRFGGAVTKVSVYAYRAPAPGAVLYVNRAEAEVAAAERDRVATLELEEPRAALRRQGANAKAEQDAQRFDAAKKQLEAQVTWRDATVGVIDSSRTVVAGDATKLVAVTGQCVLAGDAPAEIVKACETALATLDAEVPAETRVALAIVATSTGAAPPDPAAAPPDPGEPPTMPSPATIDDGGKMTLPPIRVDAPPPPPDRRPVYLGMGLVVLAAIFWWNRKRREKFEQEHPSEVPDRVPRATAKKKSRDDDADDLHRAAEAGDDGKETK